MKRFNKDEDVSDMVVHFDEPNEELIVENPKVLYDFPEMDQYFITKEMLRDYMYAREWASAEDFDLKEFLRFYQGMVKNAASK